MTDLVEIRKYKKKIRGEDQHKRRGVEEEKECSGVEEMRRMRRR